MLSIETVQKFQFYSEILQQFLGDFALSEHRDSGGVVHPDGLILHNCLRFRQQICWFFDSHASDILTAIGDRSTFCAGVIGSSAHKAAAVLMLNVPSSGRDESCVSARRNDLEFDENIRVGFPWRKSPGGISPFDTEVGSVFGY